MSWATSSDIYARYGEEYVNKLCIRRNWDEEAQQYVASESDEAKAEILNLALEDAKNLILQKLSCNFTNFSQVNSLDFPSILLWHIRMTIEVLKVGGDCTKCSCEEFDNFIKCNEVCTADGVCLIKKNSFISGSVAKFECECHGRCSCC